MRRRRGDYSRGGVGALQVPPPAPGAGDHEGQGSRGRHRGLDDADGRHLRSVTCARRSEARRSFARRAGWRPTATYPTSPEDALSPRLLAEANSRRLPFVPLRLSERRFLCPAQQRLEENIACRTGNVTE